MLKSWASKSKKSSIEIQKIDGFTLKTFRMVISDF